MMMNHQPFDFRLKNESSLFLAGPSQCGKSTLLNLILADENLYHHKFERIYWYYGQMNDDLCKNGNSSVKSSLSASTKKSIQKRPLQYA